MFNKMTPRRGFIQMCFITAVSDEEFHPQEMAAIISVLEKNGFSESEAEKEFKYFAKLSPRKAFEYGAEAMRAVLELDSNMKKKLLESMKEIALADGKVDPQEEILYNTTKMAFGY